MAGRTAERQALAKVLGAATGLIGASLVAVGLLSIGILMPPALVPAAVLAAGAGGFLLPDLRVRDEAERRRRAFRHALSSYLDLVNVILAGGGGIETSLHSAAEAGDGWASRRSAKPSTGPG